MGLGTGVLRAYYFVSFMRGLTTGVASTSAFFIAQRAGVAQSLLVASRGLGLTLAPFFLSERIGRMVWSGEAQSGFALCLILKTFAMLMIPRSDGAPALYTCFFVVGVAIALLDTSATVCVSRVHGKNAGFPLLLYCAAYGIGSVAAPWIVIALGESAWNALAVVDFSVAALLAFNRKVRGKPRNWKAKIRGLTAGAAAGAAPGSGAAGGVQRMSRQSSTESEAGQARPAAPGSGAGAAGGDPAPAVRVPWRVFRAGMAFMLVAETAETAVSCWAFSYGATTLGLPAKVAAMLPTAFYFSFTACRIFVLPLSRRLLPSTIAQAGTLLTLVMAVLFYWLTSDIALAVAGGATAEDLSFRVPALIACLGLMGAGTCPLFAMILASVLQHGELNAQESGYYNTSVNLGICAGMFLPGFVPLPKLELLGAIGIFCILSSHERDFPWRQRKAGAAGAAAAVARAAQR